MIESVLLFSKDADIGETLYTLSTKSEIRAESYTRFHRETIPVATTWGPFVTSTLEKKYILAIACNLIKLRQSYTVKDVKVGTRLSAS